MKELMRALKQIKPHSNMCIPQLEEQLATVEWLADCIRDRIEELEEGECEK